MIDMQDEMMKLEVDLDMSTDGVDYGTTLILPPNKGDPWKQGDLVSIMSVQVMQVRMEHGQHPTELSPVAIVLWHSQRSCCTLVNVPLLVADESLACDACIGLFCR
jgi:hypothetical protein